MNKTVKSIPEGYSTVTPYLIVHDVPKALEFYRKALGAEIICKLEMESGEIAHAEFKVGNSVMMIAGITPDMKLTAQTGQWRSVSFMVYVSDVDSFAQDAMKAGMIVKKEVQTQFYGDRTGTFEDPFGHLWTIGTHVEDVSIEEATRRMRAMYAKK